MNGSSHKTIGVGVALACVYIGIETNNPMLCAAGVTAPFGAMIPDIDHDKSKLGAQRKQATNTIRKAVKVGGATGFCGTLAYNLFTVGVGVPAVVSTFVIWAPILLCTVLATSDKVKSSIKFFTMHRGIMHTLWPVFGMMYGNYIVGMNFIHSLIMGLYLGYLSHLLSDAQTVMGTPLLWPLIRGNIHILPKKLRVRTGTLWEKIVMCLDLVFIGVIAMLLLKLL